MSLKEIQLELEKEIEKLRAEELQFVSALRRCATEDIDPEEFCPERGRKHLSGVREKIRDKNAALLLIKNSAAIQDGSIYKR